MLLVLTNRTVLHHSLHTVLSGSMGASVPRGSLVVAEPYQSVNAALLGDVLVFPWPGHGRERIVHRLVGSRNNEGERLLQTKGDANPNGDTWEIPAHTVEGRVVLVIPWVGYVVAWLHSKAGYILSVALLFVLCVLPFIRELIRPVVVSASTQSSGGSS